MVIPIHPPGVCDSPNKSQYRSMPVYSSRNPSSFRHSEGWSNSQSKLGSSGDGRYSPLSSYKPTQVSSLNKSVTSPGPGLIPPRGILRNATTNASGNPRLSKGGTSSYYALSSTPTAQNIPESIEQAARMTEAVFTKDKEYPSLFHALGGRDEPAQVLPISGLIEQDYPCLIERGLMSGRLFNIEHRTEIPSELKAWMSQTTASYRMGLFPEIHRAWMTIASDLYLWDFRDGSDLSYYAGLKEPIIGLAFAPAKPNLFKANLNHILCVTTPSQVVLLGFIVSCDESTLGLAAPIKTALEVIAQPIYTISSDNVLFPVVVGSSQGRIFVGGADGNVHEVFYQAQRGWIHDKCWKKNLTKSIVSSYLPNFLTFSSPDPVKEIVIDNQRYVLFTLSKSGTIQAFDLGEDGDSFSNIGCLSHETIINTVIVKSKNSLEPNSVRNILSISAIKQGDLGLVAVTDSGIRLYFSLYTGLSQRANPMIRPSTLKLAHIRLPPGYSPMSNIRKPTGAYTAYCSNGLFSISTADGDTSHVWLITPFIYPTANYAELSTRYTVPGKTIDVKEISVREIDPVVFEQPEVMSQHLPYRREIVILTSHGTIVLKASKPFELLRDLIQRQGPENIQGHFEMLPNKVQPLANCVLLASHPFLFTDNNVHDLATKAIFMYGELAPEFQQDAWPYSPRHDAIYTTVGRVLASFWNLKLLRTGTISGTTTKIIMPNISGEQVSYAIHFIQSLHTFIVNNPNLYMISQIVSTGTNNAQMENTPEGHRLMCYEMEKMSMAALKNLLSQALEVLGMWKILCEHQINIILQGVDDRLLNTTLRDMIVAGQNTIPVIIDALINKYLGDNAAVDAISIRLREVCPSLFRNEDAISSKVAEILSKAKQTTDPHEKESMLTDSLILCEQICGLGRVNIRNFCMQFAELGFPLGAIRLCESAAKAVDPQHLALLTLKPTVSSDPVANQAYNNRCDVYKIVFEILDMYYTSSNQQSPPLTGRTSDENLPSEKAKLFADETFRGILESEDEVFHIMLYNWLLERNLFGRLLEIKHPFLDAFLQRAAESVVSGKLHRNGMNGNETRILDLLWRHHELNQNHLAAAQILMRLADFTTDGLDFQQRFDYLARANICAKGVGRRGPGELLENLEDKLDVAQIQKSILDTLKNRLVNLSETSSGVFDHTLTNEVKMHQESIQRLNSQLFNISILYSDFAVPFKLHEIRLEIFNAAGHSEKPLIESLWADVIQTELDSTRESLESQLELVRRKVVTLGKKYISSPTYFPMEYIVEHLEAMMPVEMVDQAWVVRTMLEIGVSFTELLFVYEKLWNKVTQQRVSTLGGMNGQSQVCRVVMSMIKSMLDGKLEVRLPRSQHNEFIEKCKDLIALMIVEFSSKFEPEAKEITQKLNITKDRLEYR